MDRDREIVDPGQDLLLSPFIGQFRRPTSRSPARDEWCASFNIRAATPNPTT
jgi:hypothetical protein